MYMFNRTTFYSHIYKRGHLVFLTGGLWEGLALMFRSDSRLANTTAQSEMTPSTWGKTHTHTVR